LAELNVQLYHVLRMNLWFYLPNVTTVWRKWP